MLRFGLDCTGFGTYADPAVVADLAARAEAAGWEGLFLWDHLAWVHGIPSGDPWISLAAAATRTTTLRLGTYVTPLPRRRPQVLATTVAALDRLSGGRVTLSVGLGGDEAEFTTFGEDADARHRAALLDAGLEQLDDLLANRLLPGCVQQPRPPIWVGGWADAALRRAARWDGWAASCVDHEGTVLVAPDDVADAVETWDLATKDVVVNGVSDPGGSPLRDEYADAGATWWLESIHDLRGDHAAMLDRVDAGS